MLEIPESQNIAKEINAYLKGKTIQQVIAASSPHGFAFFNALPEEYDLLLNDRKIDNARAVGGMVEISLGPMRLLFSDGINARYYAKNEKLPPKHQLYLKFSDNSSLVCTVQMYGAIYAFEEGTLDNIYYQAALQKPNPLSDEFSYDYFMDIYRAAKPSLSAKALLATEQRIPGLGNGCAQDILFKANVNPRSKLTALNEQDLEALYQSIKETLYEMTVQGGRNSEKDLLGNEGGYQTILSAKTYQNPCPKCGATILRQAFLGGNVYFARHASRLKVDKFET